VRQHRDLVDEVGAEQPQVAVRRMVVVQADLEHHAVDRQRAGVVSHDQGGAGAGDVVHAEHLDPEPAFVERPQRRQQESFVQLRIEAELIDLVLPGQPAAQEP
jgi:hypothetical protein